MLAALTACMAANIVTVAEGISGFSNEGVLTVVVRVSIYVSSCEEYPFTYAMRKYSYHSFIESLPRYFLLLQRVFK